MIARKQYTLSVSAVMWKWTRGCLFRNLRPASGFSLVEVVATIALSTVLLTVSIRMLLTLWSGTEAYRRYADEESSWQSLCRTMTIDVHQSADATIRQGALTLVLMDGRRFRYARNADNQVVRLADSGGSAVIAVGVKTFTLALHDGQVWVSALTVNGTARDSSFALPIDGGGSHAP